MSNVFEPTEEQAALWDAFVASRPDNVRAVAEKFKPWKLYRMGDTGHRVTIYSFGEQVDGGVTLTVADDEVVGTLMNQEEIEGNIDAIRVTIRPDLFRMDENGKAVRKDGRPISDSE